MPSDRGTPIRSPTLGERRIRTVIEAWAHRTTELGALEGVEQVFPFENRGAEIGVTLHHPHGQIYAYPYTTPRTENQLARAAAHRARTGNNLMADILAFELADGSRILERGTHFTTFVPYAARMPIEVHLVPHRQVADLGELTGRGTRRAGRDVPPPAVHRRRACIPRRPLHRRLVPGTADTTDTAPRPGCTCS